MSSSPTITECSDAGMYMDRLDEWVQDEGKIVSKKNNMKMDCHVPHPFHH